ncbi:Fpg/Nei family DNA glycosylase [Aeoliella mucimassa]|uniref:DNA-(apurinic or apyrimidinic site) lyase n=1 Tax=Aeoliella mucimassa TaxID=2527972 RepID=A0A518AJ47_9BACT|nr:DNA-formamidopyrimidine glycosylase family protein [Aeoliella mucimassa]QDU54753.1 Formamidopyrimidine-DNA glycosylase [Aeoliella mucimassa]
MPEGDTIHRTANTLRPWLVGETITAARARDEIVDADSLVNHQVRSIEARGKHLLIHFDHGLTIHGHSGMTGSWHIYPHGEAWQKPARQAALVLETHQLCVVFFNPKTLELLTATQLRRHRMLSSLGPDLLAEEIDLPSIAARYLAKGWLPIGEAVMNQTIACGIGNVYKSELLFLQNIDPFAPAATQTEQQWIELLSQARDLMQFNLQAQPRTTRREGSGGRLWVYGRRGEPCYLCGTPIHLSRQGDLGRTTYWCPECQPPGPESKQPARDDARFRGQPPTA